MTRKGTVNFLAARGWSGARDCHPRMGQEKEVTSTVGSCHISSLAVFQVQICSDQPNKSLRNSSQVTIGMVEGTGPKIQGLRATCEPLGHQMKLAIVLFLTLHESTPTRVPGRGPDTCIITPDVFSEMKFGRA